MLRILPNHLISFGRTRLIVDIVDIVDSFVSFL